MIEDRGVMLSPVSDLPIREVWDRFRFTSAALRSGAVECRV